MCKNRREITTKFGKRLFVDCGKCSSCMQAKGNRLARMIEDNRILDGKWKTLFVHLTYDNAFIPYIRKSDFVECCGYLPVYRDYEKRKVRVRKWKEGKRKLWIHDGFEYKDVIRKVNYSYLDTVFTKFNSPSTLVGIRQWTGMYDGKKKIYVNNPDKVGVLYFPDLQNFFKRFEINFIRKNGFLLNYSRFACGEYGETTYRPHFHLLLQIPVFLEDAVISAICESWKFCYKSILLDNIDDEISASSYVASYVNSSTYLSRFYTDTKQIAPKSSHSKYYGFNRSDFSLFSILEMFEKRDFSFTRTFRIKKQTVTNSYVLPSRVVSHFFPKIKGFNNLTTDEIFEVYSYPERLAKYARKLGYDCLERYYIKDNIINEKTLDSSKDFISRLSDLSLYIAPDFEQPEPTLVSIQPLFIIEHHKHHHFLSDSLYFEFIDNEDTLHDYFSDLQLNIMLLERARSRYVDIKHKVGSDDFDLLSIEFGFYASRIWSALSSYRLYRSYFDYPNDLHRYDNISEIKTNKKLSPSLNYFIKFNNISSSDIPDDCNELIYNKIRDSYLQKQYHEKNKSRKEKEFILKQTYEYI